ncbi:hypothetical protein O6H91_01G024800 [Diphasiastrum complanatum]|uniref:Uncharacterized protein n=1 Tax=Diphasiastrum complanatum TaxID=34168 RepID=A0ACC2EP24_DIPCM|nr:hypothetical protein O6H91_01G024800 [Diphasiastrum complanatum]
MGHIKIFKIKQLECLKGGANNNHMEKSGICTRGSLNDNNESIVTGDHQTGNCIEAVTNSLSIRPDSTFEKLSLPIPLSVFGDDDHLNEEPSFQDDKFVFHDGDSEKEGIFRLQSTSHKRSVIRSMSSSSIPSETFSSYIASLYTQSNGSHQRRHSSSTVIIDPADAEDQVFVTAKLSVLGSQDAEFANQQEIKGFSSKQVKVILEDEADSEVVTSQIAASASIQDQLAYMQAWNALASVCASELAHGRALWQSAKLAGMCSSLISHSQGRSYFVALGQIHAVYLILEAAVLLYRPWLEVVSDQGKEVKAALRRCQTDWSDLKDAVYSAILEFEGRSALLSSWESLERICSIGEASDIISYRQECQTLCRLSLLPLHKNFGVPAVKWGEYQYFLPLANLWANCVSMKPPLLPQILSKA